MCSVRPEEAAAAGGERAGRDGPGRAGRRGRRRSPRVPIAAPGTGERGPAGRGGTMLLFVEVR